MHQDDSPPVLGISKAESNFRHFKRRLYERYSLHISRREYDELAEMKKGQRFKLGRTSGKRIVWLVPIRNTYVKAVFDENQNNYITCLPLSSDMVEDFYLKEDLYRSFINISKTGILIIDSKELGYEKYIKRDFVVTIYNADSQDPKIKLYIIDSQLQEYKLISISKRDKMTFKTEIGNNIISTSLVYRVIYAVL